MKDGIAARKWRERHELTPRDLSLITGYSIGAIYAFERAKATRKDGSRRIAADVWLRYRMACTAMEHLCNGGEYVF